MSGFFDSFTKSPGSSSRRSKEAATPQQRQTALTRADAPITPSSLLSPIATEVRATRGCVPCQLGLWWRFIVFWPSLCWWHCFGPPGGWGRLPITFLPRPSDG